MSYGWNRNQVRPQKRCWCGSGKKEKNCHGKDSTLRASAAMAPKEQYQRAETKKPEVAFSPWGVPGERHKLIVAPVFKGTSGPTPDDMRGRPGKYRVQFPLARPGYPLRKEREHQFIDDVVGTSHIKIAKPKAERGVHDPERMLLQLHGKNYQFVGIPNDEGFLGKLVCELDADSNATAEKDAYEAITPFLSAWSINIDVPIHVETVQVTDLATHHSSLIFSPTETTSAPPAAGPQSSPVPETAPAVVRALSPSSLSKC